MAADIEARWGGKFQDIVRAQHHPTGEDDPSEGRGLSNARQRARAL